MIDVRYVRHPDASTASVDGQTVVLAPSDRRYHALNTTAGALWELLERERTIDEVVRALLERYAVDEGTCRAEVSSCLSAMASDGLVVTDGPPPTP